MSSINRPFAAAPRAWKENQAHEIARRAGPSHDLNQSAGQLRAGLTKRGIEPVIPPRSNRKTPIEYDHEAYQRRNLIERCVNRLKQFRRIATRYEKTARAYLSMLCIAAARLWIKTVNTT
jgi:transposase